MSDNRTLERSLLGLAVVGFVVPNAMVATYMLRDETTIVTFFSDWFVTMPSAQLFADLFIVVLAFWLWSWFDRRRTSTPHWWLVPVTTLSVGICLAIPLYLWLRERTTRLAQSDPAHV